MKPQLEARCRAAVDRVCSAASAPDSSALVSALRDIKNAAIGNRTKKAFFGASRALTDCLASTLLISSPAGNVSNQGDDWEEARVQAACVCASIILPDAVFLVNALVSIATDSQISLRLEEASLRALAVVASQSDCMPPALSSEPVLQSLVSRLSLPESVSALTPVDPCAASKQTQLCLKLCSISASLLACLASKSSSTQYRIVAAGALPKLLTLVDKSLAHFEKVHEAALDAISNILKSNPETSKSFLSLVYRGSCGEERALSVLLRLLKDSRHSMTRLMAASWFVDFREDGQLLICQKISAHILLPILIKLFSDPTVLKSNSLLLERAPLVFAELIMASESLQKLALEGDAITKLANVLLSQEVYGSISAGLESPLPILQDMEDNSASAKSLIGKSKNEVSTISPPLEFIDKEWSKEYEKIGESCLTAVAAVCSLREDCRKQVIDLKLLPVIILALSNKNPSLRNAACKCARSLSRSVKYLRTVLVDAGISTPLFGLLSDSNVLIQTNACATLSNIVLDFSPMKKSVIENGGVEKIVQLLKSDDSEVKLNAVWALKNLLYLANSEVKSKVIQEMGWDLLKKLLADNNPGIQEQALNLLRNLVCGKLDDIESVFFGFGEAALSILFDKKLADKECCSTSDDSVILQTLYIIVNVATGNEKHKGMIMGNDSVLRSVLRLMNHEKPLIRLASVWCVINLSEQDEQSEEQPFYFSVYLSSKSGPKYSRDRLEALRNMGFLDNLKKLLSDDDADVRERVKTAMKNFGTNPTYAAAGSLSNELMDVDEHRVTDPMDIEGMQDLSTFLSRNGLRGRSE
ncbi:Armadillo repeat-containing protein 8 [Entophlyctis luteolus]|nr:Armadillo repeat-containing protein 8 [Entophlyctis luteolus]KAJ3345240.1 Armadillo repeat-containing protein 8 [Entophlyctis luteolus]